MAKRKNHSEDPGEFLWLMSLSDLMILLFIFFVVLYSFAYKKLNQSDYNQILAAFGNEQGKNPVEQVRKDVTKWVEDNNMKDQIDVIKKDGEIHIQMKDKVLFTSGKFKLLPAGSRVMRAISKVLDGVPAPYQIAIGGHTDDIPIHTRTIANNRELSSKRAMAVFTELGLSEATQKRTVISAHGATKPLVPNRDEKGKPIPSNQAKNRRVTIRIF